MMINEPWPHIIIDNFFDADTYSYLTDYYDNQTFTQRPNRILQHNLHVEDARLMSYFTDQFDADFIRDNFPQHRVFTDLTPKLVLTRHHPPHSDPVHIEIEEKIFSLVVYLEPVESTGTYLHNTEDVDDVHSVIEWKQNRAVMFCGVDDLTWHTYHVVDAPRLTLNFFLNSSS